MSDPSVPPRPSLRQTVRNYLAGCTWNQQTGRVESSGDPVFAWLNQTGNPGITATVQWEAGTSSDVDSAVPAAITYESWNIIKNGSYDGQTGLVTYNNKSYRFELKMVSSTPTMAPYA